jgi:hypothetical protein
MRRYLIGLVAVLGFGLLQAGNAQAQTTVVNTGLNDPFTLYYSWFIPFQIQQAAIPRPEDTVRFYSAQRQVTALTERAGLYDPIGSLGADYDPLRSFGGAGGMARLPRTTPTGVVNLNINGAGPGGYYNRVSSYYPNLRVGRGPNRSLTPVGQSPRSRSFRGGGGISMPSATTGMY